MLAISDGWEYSWNTRPDGATGWTATDSPSNPPDRNGRNSLFLRIRIPPGTREGSSLFITSADTAFSASMDGRPLYSFGLPGGSFDHRFRGWPWHIVDLPDNAAGRYLEFHVFSDYRDIGLWGEILLGSHDAIYLAMVRRDAPRFLVAAALLTIAVLGSLVFLFEKQRHSYIYLSLIVASMMLRVLADSHLKQMVLNAPLLWEFVDAGSAYLIPGLVSIFLFEIVVRPFSIVMRAFGILYVGVGLLGIVISLLGILPVYALFPPSEVLFALFVPMYLVAALATLRTQTKEAAILLGTFLFMAAFNVHDILVARSLVPWSDTMGHYVMFFFGAGLATVVALRVAALHAATEQHAVELSSLNESLERTVEERTRQLEHANRLLEREKTRLEIASITDDLTQLHNRRHMQVTLAHELDAAKRYHRSLSVIMLDLDFFKQLNDTYGHVEGDIVLRTVAALLSGELRAIDYAARYGGEEFVVVLPQTTSKGAMKVAERIRSAVEAYDWPSGRAVTISAGVASQSARGQQMSTEQIVRAADEALYQAKNSGRNRVRPWQ